MDALAQTFPVVQDLVGEAFFRAMAAVFVRRSPPMSPVLALYGADFPAFIAAFQPAGSVAYPADVARLEYARARSCHARDAAPLPLQALQEALARGEELAAHCVELHPSLGRVASPFAIVSIWAAHQGVGALEQVDPDQPEQALLLRDGSDVLVLPVSGAACRFVERLQQGETLAAATEAAMQVEPEFDLSGLWGLLFRHGAICAIHPSGGVTA